MTGDLVERLRQRLSDLEAIARAASHGPWVVGSEWGAQNTRVFQAGSLVDSVGQAVFQAQVSNSPQCRENAAYIAANGPDVVLRTIQAHRKIIERHKPRPLMNNDGVRVVEMQCSACVAVDEIDWFNDEIAYESFPCDDVLALASIYFPEGTEPT